MEVKAKARYIRMSPKKVRLVLDVIRGMGAGEALKQLQFIDKRASEPVTKLLNSAITNATHNFGLEESNLFIKEITAEEGPTLKRWKARAFGRATPIRKRTSHIGVVLAEKVPSKEIKKRKQGVGAPVSIEEMSKIEQEIKKSSPRPGPGREKQESKDDGEEVRVTETREFREKHKDRSLDELRKKQEKKGFLRRMFSRKTG